MTQPSILESRPQLPTDQPDQEPAAVELDVDALQRVAGGPSLWNW